MNTRYGKRAVAAAATLFLGLSGNAFAGQEYNANIFFPAQHPLAKHGYVEWAEAVKKASGGELVAKVFTGTVLLPARAGLSGVRDGVAQVGYHAAGYTPADLPLSTALQELGFNYADPLVASAANTDFNMNDPEMQAQWEKAGVVFGGGYSTPTYNLMCKTPVRTLAEIKGKRVRTNGTALSRWAETVGAVPVNVPSSEMYQGIEKGTLDCALNVASDLKSRSLWDVAKHTTMAPLGIYWAGPMWGYNQDFWNSLSAENRRTLFDASALAMAKLYIGYNASIQTALAEAKEHGVSIYQPDQAMIGSIEKFATDNISSVYQTATDKYGVKNPEDLIGRFQKAMEKWEKLFADVNRDDANAIAAVIKKELFDKIDAKSYGAS